MNGMSIMQAAEICGGTIRGRSFDGYITGRVVIDSREVSSGDIFVAYKGEKLDGHNYINAAFAQGAACCLAEHAPENSEGAVIIVGDVQTALEKICIEYRKSLHIPMIGITGSVGKTTAKEMISSVLSERFRVLKNEKNLNNQIGVPMTISRIEPEHQAAVIEMGISTFGDMTELARMVLPDIMVFTVIGHAHLEFLHDLDGVLKAKTEVLDYMPDNGLVIVNGDDEKLRNLSFRQRKLSYGLGSDCDVKAEKICIKDECTVSCSITYGERTVKAEIPAYGRHMVYAALEGAAVGIAMGLSDEEIEKGIASYETVGRRGVVTKTDLLTLVDDCYNANPDSMESGIDSLMMIPGRHVCILGDMLEQGENELAIHSDLGGYAVKRGVDSVICSGMLARNISLAAGEIGIYYETRQELIEALPKLIKKGDVVLVKASRASHFEEISEALKKL